MNTTEFKKNFLEKLGALLKPLHFKRKQNIFSYSNKDLTYYICVQSSVDSTAEIMKTTVNIEIASSRLSYLDDLSIPGYLHRHFVKNIGDYAGQQQKKWWTIDNTESALKAEKEIEELITTQVLPEINSLKTTDDLARLWEKQVNPGLTSHQRREYLSLLRLAK
ncbi:MAG: DUF4304 domain-containing protein [Luteolibacter sp.]